MKLSSCHERLLCRRRAGVLTVRKWPIGDLRLKGWSPGSRTSMYPYVALRGPTYRENSPANHTWRPSSREIACFKASEARLPCGFDAHRPLHSQDRSGSVGTRDWGLTRRSCGKALEPDADLAVVSCPHIYPSNPTIHTYSHTRRVRKIMCLIPTLFAPRR